MDFIKSIFRIIRSVILTVFLICLVIFLVNNREALTLHFYPLPFEVETRVFVAMLICFLFGIFFGIMFFSKNLIGFTINRLKDRWRIKRLEKVVNDGKNEIKK